MAIIPTLPGEAPGDEMVGRNLMVLLPRFPNASSSANEFSALTDVPVFLGYMLSYILTGIMLVQVFLYYLSFRGKDPLFMKLTVFSLFLIECISSTIATVLVIYSIITQGYLSYSALVPGFQALGALSGIVSSMVHAFYCWRIHMIGGPWAVIVVIMLVSTAQCVMQIISTTGALGDGDILGAGTSSYSEPYEISFNVIWLGGSAVCDIMIATTILYLQNKIMKSLGKTSPLASRVERVMSVTVDTGMITAIGAGIELLLYLILRDSLVHFVLFYPLPKLYANCLMATLNARMAYPEKDFLEMTFINAELSHSDEFFKGHPGHQSLPTSIEIKIQEATIYRGSMSSSVMDIKRHSANTLNENYLGLSFNAAPKRSSILDLELHHYDQDYSGHDAKLPMPQQRQQMQPPEFQPPLYSLTHPPEFQPPPPPSFEFPSHLPLATYSSVPSSPNSPKVVLPPIKRHSVMPADLFQRSKSLKNRKSVGKTVEELHGHNPEHENKQDTSMSPILFHSASTPNLTMPWEDSTESAISTISTENQPLAPVRPLSLPAGQKSYVESDVDTYVFPVPLAPLRAPEATLQPMVF